MTSQPKCEGKRRNPKPGEWPFPALEEECHKCHRRASKRWHEGEAFIDVPTEAPCPMRLPINGG